MKAVLAIDIMKELQSNLEGKVNLSILAPELLGQMKPVEFFHQWNQYPLSALSHSILIDYIQVQKPILVAATDQMPDHIWSRE